MANSLQWGNVVFHLNHDQFREGFLDGRRYYFEDINGEHPERAVTLNATDVLAQILVRDKHNGHYHFDFEGPDHPVEFVAIFLGYATAPLLPETANERERRLRDAERVELIPGEQRCSVQVTSGRLEGERVVEPPACRRTCVDDLCIKGGRSVDNGVETCGAVGWLNQYGQTAKLLQAHSS